MTNILAQDIQLSSDLLVRAHHALRDFAQLSLNHRIFAGLLQKLSWSEPLTQHGAVSSGLSILSDRNVVDDALARVSRPTNFKTRSVTVVGEPAGSELWRFSESCSSEMRLGVDVLLRRALDPFEGLATVPLRALFSPDETKKIYAVESSVPADDAISIRRNAHVTVIAKLTRLCNLRCVYCHDWATGRNQTMGPRVLLATLSKVLQDPEYQTVDIVWHGGEPTLLGRKGFLRVLALQRRFRQSTQLIRNIIQTNATTIDKEWADFLALFRFQVGVSVDGPKNVHDHTRLDAHREGTYDKVQRGLQALKAAGIKPAVLMVIGPSQLRLGAKAIVEFFRQEAIENIALLPVRPMSGSARADESYVEPHDFVRLLIDIERELSRRSDVEIRVRELEAARRVIRDEPANFCELAGKCAGHYFAIEPQGDVTHCDKYRGDDSFTLGNIVEDDFSSIRNSVRLRQIRAANEHSCSQKNKCPYFQFCQGWCPHEEYAAARYSKHYDSLCCGQYELFEYMKTATAT